MRPAVAVLVILSLAACDAEPPESRTMSTTGARMQPYVAVPEGAIPRGTAAAISTLSPEPPITRQLLVRGRGQYDVFCSPCHGRAGYGDGVVVQRGFPAPSSLHTPQQRSLTRTRIVKVTTEGFGLMYAFAERIPMQDRWAIARYVKALQLSQQFPIDQLPEDLRRQVEQ